eukprot:5132632-Amphidinium_carterae.1
MSCHYTTDLCKVDQRLGQEVSGSFCSSFTDHDPPYSERLRHALSLSLEVQILRLERAHSIFERKVAHARMHKGCRMPAKYKPNKESPAVH